MSLFWPKVVKMVVEVGTVAQQVKLFLGTCMSHVGLHVQVLAAPLLTYFPADASSKAVDDDDTVSRPLIPMWEIWKQFQSLALPSPD